MTVRQFILKKLYPLFMRLSKSSGARAKVVKNKQGAAPRVPFYQLKTTRNNGQELDFALIPLTLVLALPVAAYSLYCSSAHQTSV